MRLGSPLKAALFAILLVLPLLLPSRGAASEEPDPPPQAEAAPDAGVPCPVDGPLAGAWEASDGGRMVRFSGSETERRYALVLEGRLDLVAPVVACAPGRVEICSFGQRRAIDVAVEGDRLELHDPFTGEALTYHRVDGVPEVFEPRPLELPAPTDLPPERVAEVVDELARRRELDQEVRKPPPDGARMMEVDADNTAYLEELVREVGWIDPDRFGDEAANAAFLIVQHSGDLPLMLAALPELEAQGRPGEYALLYDRLQIRRGLPQRYGTQLGWAEGGSMGLLPIETLEGIDATRAEVGLGPLDDYLARFELEERRVLDCE